MAKRAKMQRVVMGILATMFVASLVLAVVSFVWPAPVSAEYWESCTWDCSRDWCEGCLYCYEKKIGIYQGYPNPHCTSEVCYRECFVYPYYCPGCQ